MAANHRAAAARTGRPSSPPPPKTANVVPVLALGDTAFVHFRGRAFAVPPVPWHAGTKIQAALVAARDLGTDMGPAEIEKLHAIMAPIPDLVWSLCRPVGILPRLFRWLRILPNPFRHATEGELGALLGLFWERRTRSSVSLSARPARTP